MSETEFVIEPGRQDIIMTRVFDAPPSVVFQACTDPKHIPDWWGPREHTTEVDRMDVAHGGLWRLVSRDGDGNEFAFRGVHHDVVPAERIVRTFEFEGAPGHVTLETLTLEELGGRTKYVAVSVAQSVEDRDAIIQSGMQEGASETMERLAEVVSGIPVA